MPVLEMPKFQKDREATEDEFMELVYDIQAAPVIFKHFPNGYFADASDEIHPGRFEVVLPKESRDKFYTLMILEQFVHSCLCFELQLRTGKDLDEIRGWINSAVKLKDKGYVQLSKV